MTIHTVDPSPRIVGRAATRTTLDRFITAERLEGDLAAERLEHTKTYDDPEARAGWNRLARHTDQELEDLLTSAELTPLILAEQQRRRRGAL